MPGVPAPKNFKDFEGKWNCANEHQLSVCLFGLVIRVSLEIIIDKLGNSIRQEQKL